MNKKNVKHLGLIKNKIKQVLIRMTKNMNTFQLEQEFL